VLAAGLILASCIGSFTLPKLNAYLGYGDLCREAKHIAQTNRTATFYTWKMHRPDSMDVYLGEDIVEVTEEELLSMLRRRIDASDPQIVRQCGYAKIHRRNAVARNRAIPARRNKPNT
jgi:hypothetical protein